MCKIKISKIKTTKKTNHNSLNPSMAPHSCKIADD